MFLTRMCVQKLHRVLAVYLWGSTWERTSRTNLFRSVQNGGLGLVHLFSSQLVSRFVFLQKQKDPFLRAVIQVRLQNFLPKFLVCTQWIHRRGVQGYLREVVGAFQILKVRFSMQYISGVKRRRFYTDLSDLMLQVPIYRILNNYGQGGDVLKIVKKMAVRPSVKTFFFHLHSGTLPVKPWLEEKGIYVPWGTNCLICRKPETVDHIFLDCWEAVFLWDILQRTLKKDLPITPYGIRFLPVNNEHGAPYVLFMLLVLHVVWKTRMGVHHADQNVRPAREYFVESIAYLRDVYKEKG
ncbi:uncharacterized protein LOC144123225 [Amblyomma americanum]